MARSPFDSPTVCDVLDIFYADLDHEPDFAAIRTRLLMTNEPLYTVCEELLRAVWFVYESPQAGMSRLYKAKHGL